MVSVLVSAIAPIAYLVVVLGSFAVFSTIYRRRKALESSNIEPWFLQHRERDIYLTLLHLDHPCPPKLLKAALLERAKEDVSRIYSLREDKTAATMLLQKGSIGESTFQRIVAAEADMNAEIADVVAEAKALGGEEWGQTILPQANEYYQKLAVLKTIDRTKQLAERERKKWDEEQALRKRYQEELRAMALKDLTGEDGQKASEMGKDDMEAEIPNGNANHSDGSTERKSKKKKKKKEGVN
jgi:translocation protein SEC66